MQTNKFTTTPVDYCYILTLDQAVNQRCTCVNKRKKKRKQVGIMKEYRQVPAAVELVGDRKSRVRVSWQTEGCSPQWAPVEQPQPRYGRSAAIAKRRSWVNIAVCPCLHSSLTHNRNINPFKNKVWEIHIFIKKCVSFVHYHWLCFCLYICIRVRIVYNTTVLLFTLAKFYSLQGIYMNHFEKLWFMGLVSLFSSISTFMGYLMPKLSL